jgi:hypothetical protein
VVHLHVFLVGGGIVLEGDVDVALLLCIDGQGIDGIGLVNLGKCTGIVPAFVLLEGVNRYRKYLLGYLEVYLIGFVCGMCQRFFMVALGQGIGTISA